nr:hypothetical protein YSBCXYJI_YSBCXYJI_CDS_0019 [Caudoviricetes sp.]
MYSFSVVLFGIPRIIQSFSLKSKFLILLFIHFPISLYKSLASL